VSAAPRLQCGARLGPATPTVALLPLPTWICGLTTIDLRSVCASHFRPPLAAARPGAAPGSDKQPGAKLSMRPGGKFRLDGFSGPRNSPARIFNYLAPSCGQRSLGSAGDAVHAAFSCQRAPAFHVEQNNSCNGCLGLFTTLQSPSSPVGCQWRRLLIVHCCRDFAVSCCRHPFMLPV